MNHRHRHVIHVVVLVLVGTIFSLSAVVLAQETTTSSSKPTSVTRIVKADTAQVIYVSGDDVV
jgi:hypothetical protein